MKGVVFAGDRKLQILDFPDPTPGPGEVVLEIKASGMCGSDLKFYRAVGLQARSKHAQTLDISFQTMLNLIDDTSFLLRGGLQDRVWRDVIDEMLPQIGGKICKALVA